MPRGALQLKLLVGKPLGLRLLVGKPLDWRPRGVQLKKLLPLLLLPLPLPLLPAQTILTSLGLEVTMSEWRPLISRLSTESENGDFARTSEECDILPTTTDSTTLRPPDAYAALLPLLLYNSVNVCQADQVMVATFYYHMTKF